MTYKLGEKQYRSVSELVRNGKSLVSEDLLHRRLQERWRLADALSYLPHQKGRHIYDEHRAIMLYLTRRYTRAELADICGMCQRSITHILEKHRVFA